MQSDDKSRQESGWLIESTGARWGSGYFWIGLGDFHTWGTIDKAVRFARKEDAERVIGALHAEDKRRYGYVRPLKYEACEHIWSDGEVVAPSSGTARADDTYVPWDLDTAKQEICDLFARNNGGTLQEADIIDNALDEILTPPPTSKDALWNLVRLAAEGSDWNRDNETMQEWAFRKLSSRSATTPRVKP